MAVVDVRPEAEIRLAARVAFEEHRRRVLQLLPQAEVEHIGATSVPGALTKGDLDVLVRVDEDGFGAAVDALRSQYAVHQRENWTPTYASFADPQATEPPVGVQLAVAGSPDDLLFGRFRDALLGDPSLLAEYNALKLRNDGVSYELYTTAKADFIERVLA